MWLVSSAGKRVQASRDSDWMKKWRESFKPIVQRSNANQILLATLGKTLNRSILRPCYHCISGNNCRIKKAASEKRHIGFLENLTWGSFGKLMALTITFAICSALAAHKCNIDCRWRSSENLFFSIRELSRRHMPGLYLLYFFRR